MFVYLQVLAAIAGETTAYRVRSTEYSVGCAGAILLFQRNIQLSRVQHSIGLILDQGGATDEV